MKTLIVLIATVAASAAMAKGGSVSAADFGCYELRSAINNNGVLHVDGKRLVAGPGAATGSFCNGFNETSEQIWIKTADFNNCPVYTCVAAPASDKDSQ